MQVIDRCYMTPSLTSNLKAPKAPKPAEPLSLEPPESLEAPADANVDIPPPPSPEPEPDNKRAPPICSPSNYPDGVVVARTGLMPPHDIPDLTVRVPTI